MNITLLLSQQAGAECNIGMTDFLISYYRFGVIISSMSLSFSSFSSTSFVALYTFIFDKYVCLISKLLIILMFF